MVALHAWTTFADPYPAVGRWQQGRDLNWYAKGDQSASAQAAAEARKEELRKIKEAEEDALSEALGYAPIPRSNPNETPLGKKEVERAIKESAGDEGIEGAKGIGFGAFEGGRGGKGEDTEVMKGVGLEALSGGRRERSGERGERKHEKRRRSEERQRRRRRSRDRGERRRTDVHDGRRHRHRHHSREREDNRQQRRRSRSQERREYGRHLISRQERSRSPKPSHARRDDYDDRHRRSDKNDYRKSR